MRELDPDFYEDDIDSDFEDEEYIYDTFDQIIDGNNIEDLGNDYNLGLDAIESGLAFALAEEMAEEMARSVDKAEAIGGIDVDENTDRENWDKVNKLVSLQTRHQKRLKLRPFEAHIQAICEGRIPLFDDDD